MKTDRELLEELFNFMVKRSYIMGDKASVRDMVSRYRDPPLTMLFRVSMKMTVNDYNTLAELLKKIAAHLNPVGQPETKV